jgi:hypothetical protein
MMGKAVPHSAGKAGEAVALSPGVQGDIHPDRGLLAQVIREMSPSGGSRLLGAPSEELSQLNAERSDRT